MRRVLVVGAGLAGLRAAQEMRERGFTGELTIVGDEQHLPYNRPPLSKQVLAGTMDPAECSFPLDGLDADWILGHPAVALLADSRVVRLDDGRELHYDGLVIATGRRAREWPGRPDLSGFHVLRDLDDAVALRRAVELHPRVVIIGAGFVGCEVAATLRGLGLAEVTLVDVAPTPMPALGAAFGARAARMHADHGVRMHLGSGVAEFEGTGAVEAVRLVDGTRLPADVVLLALGSLPNTEWLEGSGLTLQQGNVLCDSRCFAVGREDVVAAGDVACWPHPGMGDEALRIEHWTNASDMGRRAGANLLQPAAARAFAPVPTFWSDQYDAKIKAVGAWSRVKDVTFLEDDIAGGGLVAVGHCEDGLIGALLVNRNKSFIDYRRQLASRYADG